MGASKEMFIDMREREFTINTTLKIKGFNLIGLENSLRHDFNVIDFKIIADTEKLYANDEQFKKLVKAKKEATKNCELYINRNNE